MSSIAIDPSANSTGVQRATPYASSAQTPTSAQASSTISSSDFLVLLVTQLKNQDPTQPVDPAAYVQQLVGVNSLEQLIDMNKQLTSIGSSLNNSTPVTTGG